MKPPEIFILQTTEQARGAYKLCEVSQEAKNGDTVPIKPTEILYEADGSLGGDYGASGVIREMWKHDMRVGLIMHPDDVGTQKFPFVPDE